MAGFDGFEFGLAGAVHKVEHGLALNHASHLECVADELEVHMRNLQAALWHGLDQAAEQLDAVYRAAIALADTKKDVTDAPAVLAWAVQGARDYFEMDGLDTPPVIQAEIDAYRKEQDSIAQFLEERCQTIEQARELRERNAGIYFTDNEFEVPNSDLYQAYEKFCRSNGEYQRSHRRFTQNMLERGFKQDRQRSRYWEGLRLIETSGL